MKTKLKTIKSILAIFIFILILLIVQKNCLINIENHYYFLYCKTLILTDNNISNDNIEQLKNFKHLKEIRIYGTNINKLTFINSMNGLEKISFLGSETHLITNLNPIQNCNNLREITIAGISVENLNDFRNLNRLEYLDLSFDNNNNDRILDIEGLKNLNSLKSLSIINVKINNINIINNLNSLETFIVSKNILSQEEITTLKNNNITVIET